MATKGLPTTCGSQDPRGLGPALRRDRRRAAARRPACRSSARPTWTSSRWAPRPSTPPTARRHNPWDLDPHPRRLRRRLVRPSSRRSRRRSRSAPTPAARSASPPRSPARSASSRPTAGCPATASSRWPRASTRPGPCTRTVLDAALLHDGHRRPRPDGLDRRSTRRCRRWSRPPAGPTSRACASASSRSSAARASRPGCGARFDESVALLQSSRRRGRRGLAARASTTRSRPTT